MPDAQTMPPASSARFASATDALDWAERVRVRIRVHYGYASDAARDHTIARDGRDPAPVGQDWGDVYDVAGTIGRSMGTPGRPETRIRLLINNRTSIGGPGMIGDNCIVRVRYANREHGGDLYRHPDYLPPNRGDARSQRDYARHFAADPADARGCVIDRLTASLQDAGRSYTLRAGAFNDQLPDPWFRRGVVIIADTERTIAIVARDGTGIRYWGDGTPEHFDASGAALSYP